jgi:flagellin-like hook-associated protein FlgL
MRITQNYTNRSYLKNNNKVLSKYNNSMEKIWSNMDYFRASDNPINASKAMTVRKNLRDLDMYDDNLETADGLFKAAEDNLYTLANKVYLNVQDKLEQACNGTYSQDELDIIANELNEYAEISVETLNSDYAERNLFGGTNNSSLAFQTATDENTGEKLVTYNGVILNDIRTNDDGELYYYNRITSDEYDAAVAADPDTTDVEKVYNSSKTLSSEDMYELVNKDNPDTVFKGTDKDNDTVYYTRTASTLTDAEYNNLSDDEKLDIDVVEDAATGTKTYYTKDYVNDSQMFDMLKAANPDDYTTKTTSSGDVVYQANQYIYYDSSEEQSVPGGKPIYVDIGIGISYNKNGEVDSEQSALDLSLNGAKITGYGTDSKDGKVYSQNFVQLIYDAATALKNGDIETANATLDRLSAANSGILTEITTLGAKQNSIEFYTEKNDEYRTSLQSRQNDVEYTDLNKEIINMESAYSAYQAALQLSSNILPVSIFDFI